MDQSSLVMDEIDAGAELAREFSAYAPVNVAFWLKTSDDENRYLYLASEQISDTNFDLAYGEVLRLTNQLNSMHLDPFRVKVVGVDDPLAIAALDLLSRFPGLLPTRVGGSKFGGVSVDDVYIYAPPSTSNIVPSS